MSIDIPDDFERSTSITLNRWVIFIDHGLGLGLD